METKQNQNLFQTQSCTENIDNNFIHRVPRLRSQAIPVQLEKHIC